MALVDYSDSSDDGGAFAAPTAKRRRIARNGDSPPLPPLPASFHDLYSSTVRVSPHDDPSLHGGRRRIVPHIEGNWAAHIYLEWIPTAAESKLLSAVVCSAQSQHGAISAVGSNDNSSTIHSLLQNDLGVPQPLHVSLSRPLVLTQDEKDAFLEDARQALRSNDLRPFAVRLTDVAWHPNEDRTRWFLAMQTIEDEVTSRLKLLLTRFNKVATKYGQPVLYEDNATHVNDESNLANIVQAVEHGAERSDTPATTKRDGFHVSIAWSLKDPTQTGVEDIDPHRFPSVVRAQIQRLLVAFAEVKVRIGKDVSVLPLDTRQHDAKGIFG